MEGIEQRQQVSLRFAEIASQQVSGRQATARSDEFGVREAGGRQLSMTHRVDSSAR
jgi:hypothetical protein